MAKISQIKLIEIDDFNFRIEFLLNNENALQTEILPKNTTRETARSAIELTVTSYLANRADDNFQQLKTAYQDKTINI